MMRLLTSGLLAALLSCNLMAAGARPNIVVVFIDDMGWADLSCFGNSAVRTEHIDQLASEGLRFEQFYVNSPICSPSRVALSTGQYPQRWRIGSYLDNRRRNTARGMAQWLDPRAPTLARLLQGEGYATGHFGKWHMGGQRDVGDAPLISEYGFDKSLTNFEGLGPRVLPLKNAWDGKPPQKHALGSDQLGHGPIMWADRSLVTARFTAAALQFVQEAQEAERPFLVNLWPDDVHSPFFPPAARRGDGAKRTLYHGVLETMDEQLGVLFDYIRNDPALRENTVILLCGDNGPEQGAGSAGRLRGLKTMLFEGGIRSSLIVWAPGLMRQETIGTVNTTSVFSAIDLVPSLLSIADCNVPAGIRFDGENVADVLLGKSSGSRKQPICFRRPPDRDRYYGVDDLPDLAIRDGRWKLLCEYDGSQAMLFDLDSDASEQTNRIATEPEVANALRRKVLSWHAEMPPDNGDTWVPRPRRRPAPKAPQAPTGR